MTPEEIKLYGEPRYNRGGRSATTKTHRRCNICHQWKEYSEYHKDTSRYPQIGHSCKECDVERKAVKRNAKYVAIEAKHGKLIPGSQGKVTETHKRCPRCKRWLEHNCFGKNTANLLSLNNCCTDCAFDKDLQSRYGITLTVYNQMLKDQGGQCLVCGATKGSQDRTRLFVDHDHSTGKVRGLLCHQCNVFLGFARDDAAILRQGIVYLERFSK